MKMAATDELVSRAATVSSVIWNQFGLWICLNTQTRGTLSSVRGVSLYEIHKIAPHEEELTKLLIVLQLPNETLALKSIVLHIPCYL